MRVEAESNEGYQKELHRILLKTKGWINLKWCRPKRRPKSWKDSRKAQWR